MHDQQRGGRETLTSVRRNERGSRIPDDLRQGHCVLKIQLLEVSVALQRQLNVAVGGLGQCGFVEPPDEGVGGGDEFLGGSHLSVGRSHLLTDVRHDSLCERPNDGWLIGEVLVHAAYGYAGPLSYLRHAHAVQPRLHDQFHTGLQDPLDPRARTSLFGLASHGSGGWGIHLSI